MIGRGNTSTYIYVISTLGCFGHKAYRRFTTPQDAIEATLYDADLIHSCECPPVLVRPVPQKRPLCVVFALQLPEIVVFSSR